MVSDGAVIALLDEDLHHVTADLDGPLGIEDGGGHERAMLGEGIGRKAWIAVFLRTGRNSRPVQGRGFLPGELEEVVGEALPFRRTCSLSRLVGTGMCPRWGWR